MERGDRSAFLSLETVPKRDKNSSGMEKGEVIKIKGFNNDVI